MFFLSVLYFPKPQDISTLTSHYCLKLQAKRILIFSLSFQIFSFSNHFLQCLQFLWMLPLYFNLVGLQTCDLILSFKFSIPSSLQGPIVSTFTLIQALAPITWHICPPDLLAHLPFSQQSPSYFKRYIHGLYSQILIEQIEIRACNL